MRVRRTIKVDSSSKGEISWSALEEDSCVDVGVGRCGLVVVDTCCRFRFFLPEFLPIFIVNRKGMAKYNHKRKLQLGRGGKRGSPSLFQVPVWQVAEAQLPATYVYLYVPYD